MYWTSAKTFEYNFADLVCTELDMSSLISRNYPNVRFMQSMLVRDDEYPVRSTADSLSSPTVSDQISSRLSTMQEEIPSEVPTVSDTTLLQASGNT